MSNPVYLCTTFLTEKLKSFGQVVSLAFLQGSIFYLMAPVTWGDYVLVYTIQFFAVILFSCLLLVL